MPDPGSRLSRSFFDRSTLDVARDLLGSFLVKRSGGARVSGIIVETEAYIGEEDDACHARAGRTQRTGVMYGPPGFAYVYLNYGLHWMFNIVAERCGFPAAVLIRAVKPVEGLDRIASRRKMRPEREWTNGPGKLTQGFGITGADHGIDLCQPQSILFLERGEPIPERRVTRTPRVGLNKVLEPWKSIAWRFLVEG